MSRSKTADVARLYHAHSSHIRSRLIDMSPDEDRLPPRFRVYAGSKRTALPGRDFEIEAGLGAVLQSRRSQREFALRPLPLETLGRLLHASYGVRGRRQVEDGWIYERPAPSAGGRYPLELYVATQSVERLEDGIYHYDAYAHEIELRRPGLAHGALAELAMGQDMIRDANVVIIITAIPERTMWKYGQRGYRFLFLDAGHVGQSLYLLATAMGLGAVAIGGFLDGEMGELLRLPDDEAALYVICIGQPRPGRGETR